MTERIAMIYNLSDVLSAYSFTAPAASLRKLRYRVNCWLRHASGSLPITSQMVAEFRASGASVGLSPVTIEGTISDVVTMLRGTGQSVPDVGKRLKKPPLLAEQPTLDDVGRVYALVDSADWPRRWTQSQRSRWWRGYLFLSVWTGLRVEDMRQLQWSDVFADRIERQASKTSARHVFPMTLDVRRHLDLLRGLDAEFVVPVAHGSLRFVRNELTDLCELAKVDRFGPQMLRRASISEWSCCGNDAGALIHGCGLGVRNYYVNPLKVLARAAERFTLPREMQDPTARTATDQAVKRLTEIAKRLGSPEHINRLARMAEAW